MLIQTLKGFRDFSSDDLRRRNYVSNTLRKVFELYGFEGLETPTLEYAEILDGKYGAEGDKLMYRFTDNGDRKVALRYDQTVPLARFVAQNKNTLSFPYKRYQMQNVFRADNTQKGRFREFLQCDIDIAGSESILSDAEILAIVNSAFERLGFMNYTIQINDRKIFEGLDAKAITIIDKLEKLGEGTVSKELKENGYSGNLIQELRDKKEPDYLEEIKKTSVSLGVPIDRLKYNPTLARGLDYYTGLIIEVSIKDYTAGSVGGGGRYDELIGMFSTKKIPAVGFAFGFDRIIDALNENNLFPANLVNNSVLVTVFNNELRNQSIKTANLLRKNKISTAIYSEDKPIDKQLKYAVNKGYKYLVLVGPDEAKSNYVTIKNLNNKTQETLPFEKLPEFINTK